MLKNVKPEAFGPLTPKVRARVESARLVPTADA
jgi:hypothetical protein